MNETALRLEFRPPLAGAADGPLAGASFVAKDNFDVVGHRTGCGEPAWLEEATPAARNAAAVDRLLRAGASLVGKAHLDELAFSLSGTNVHYGTPVNPAASDHEPGGSSSGCASAVASGRVDLALGSDTAGSVRVPASYCGILGFRPSHGRVPTGGLAPLAPSFDTVGWLTRSGELVERVGGVLLDARRLEPGSVRVLVADDARQLLDRECLESFHLSTQRVAIDLGATLVPIDLRGARTGPQEWAAAFRILQGREAWRCWGEWITRRRPPLGPGVAARFAFASRLTAEEERAAAAVRAEVRERLAELLAPATLLALPTTVGPALPLTMSRDAKNERREKTLRLTTIAPLIGAPAVSLPLGSLAGLPLGLSLLAAPGKDEHLLAVARTLVP